jgi:hypothetical protein
MGDFKMRTICLLAITLGLTLARAEEITIKPNWIVGDKQVYEIKTTSQFGDDQEDKIAKRKFTIAIEVIRADDKTIHLKCKYGEIELENEYRTLYVDHQVGKSFVLQCNPDGSKMRIENVDEIKSSYPKLIRDLYEVRREREQEEEMNKSIFDHQKTEEAQAEFINSFVADALFLFCPYGRTQDTAIPISTEGDLPNPFYRKELFPCDNVWRLSAVKNANSLFEISWSQSYNAQKCAPLMEAAIREQEKELGVKYSDEVLHFLRKRSDTTTASFQYDKQLAWMTFVKKQNDQGGQFDWKRTWEYRLKTPKK